MVKRHVAKLLAFLLIAVMIIGTVPASAAKKADKGTKTQEENTVTEVNTTKKLEKKLANKKSDTIVFKTDDAGEIILNKVSGSENKNLEIDAPKADIVNKGVYNSVKITAAKSYREEGSGNSITITDNKIKVIVAKGASIKELELSGKKVTVVVEKNATVENLVCKKKGAKVTLNVAKKANVSVTLSKKTKITVTGSKKSNVDITNNAKGSSVRSSVPAEINANKNTEVVLEKGAEKSVIKAKNENVAVNMTNNTEGNPTVKVAQDTTSDSGEKTGKDDKIGSGSGETSTSGGKTGSGSGETSNSGSKTGTGTGSSTGSNTGSNTGSVSNGGSSSDYSGSDYYDSSSSNDYSGNPILSYLLPVPGYSMYDIAATKGHWSVNLEFWDLIYAMDTYDAQEHVLKEGTASYKNDLKDYDSYKEYEFEENIYSYILDENGDEIIEICSDGSFYENKYSNHKLTERVKKDQFGNVIGITTCEWNADYTEEKVIEKDTDGNASGGYIYKYTPEGIRYEQIKIDEDGNTLVERRWNPKNEKLLFEGTIKSGRNLYYSATEEYTYDETTDNLLRETWKSYDSDGSVRYSYYYEYEYNAEGKKTKEIWAIQNGEVVMSNEISYEEGKEITTAYGSSGNVLKISIEEKTEDDNTIVTKTTVKNADGTVDHISTNVDEKYDFTGDSYKTRPVKYTYEDAAGNVINSAECIYNDVINSITVTYNDEGEVTVIFAHYDRESDVMTVSFRDGEGNITKTIEKILNRTGMMMKYTENGKVLFERDVAGRVIKAVISEEYYDSDQGKYLTEEVIYENEYTPVTGYISSEKKYLADGTLDWEKKYTYYENGLLAEKEISYSADSYIAKDVYTYYPNEKNTEKSNFWVYDSGESVEYLISDTGQVLSYEKKDKDGNYTSGYEKKYNEKGDIVIKINYGIGKKPTQTTEYEYDANGNNVKIVNKDSEGVIIGLVTYGWDEKDRMILYKEFKGKEASEFVGWEEYEYREDGTFKLTEKDVYGKICIVETYTDDTDDGDILTVAEYDKDGETIIKFTEYLYNGNGSLKGKIVDDRIKKIKKEYDSDLSNVIKSTDYSVEPNKVTEYFDEEVFYYEKYIEGDKECVYNFRIAVNADYYAGLNEEDRCDKGIVFVDQIASGSAIVVKDVTFDMDYDLAVPSVSIIGKINDTYDYSIEYCFDEDGENNTTIVTIFDRVFVYEFENIEDMIYTVTEDFGVDEKLVEYYENGDLVKTEYYVGGLLINTKLSGQAA